MVTLGRAEFDLLCSKLNGLENSIADLRREISRSALSQRDEGADNVSAGTPPTLNTAEREVPHRRPNHTEVHGIHTRNDAVCISPFPYEQAMHADRYQGEIVHFGAGSIPAMLYSLGQGQGQNEEEKMQLQEFLGKSVLPLFGLDNESATYPFVDLWGLPHGSFSRAQELAKALPNDAQMLQLWRCYRDMVYVIYPGIIDPGQFEPGITQFLIDRVAAAGSSEGVSEQAIYGKSYHWLAILFACLASGAQGSAMPRKERELTSQVYSMCSLSLSTARQLIILQYAAALNAFGSLISYPGRIWRASKHFW